MAAERDYQRAKRDLRLRIGRLRRRVDGRIRSLQREGRRLASWRTYVRRYPAHAVLAALGLGLTASAGLRGRWMRLLGMQFVARTVSKAVDRVLGELERIWQEASATRRTGEPTGAEDGRS